MKFVSIFFFEELLFEIIILTSYYFTSPSLNYVQYALITLISQLFVHVR